MIDIILKFITNFFNLTVLALLLISSAFLIIGDCAEYKKKGLIREYKFSKVVGYFYIIGGFAVYIAASFIRV